MESDVDPHRERKRLYFPALDGVRFLAFVLVLFSHMRDLSCPNLTIERALNQIRVNGWIGVDIFLVLSSHLIVTLLLTESEETGALDIARFYLRRALRIWPLYYPYLFFACLIYPKIQHYDGLLTVQYHLFPFALMLGNFSFWYYTQYISYSIAPLWTICMEEQFYLVLPVLIFFGRVWKWQYVCGIMIAAELATISCRAYAILNGVPYPFVWVVTVCRLDSIIVGILTAVIARRRYSLPGNAFLLAAILLFVLIILGGYIGTTINTTWQLLVADLAAGCVVLGATHGSVGSAVFGTAPARFLGRISFGLYVFHEICLNVVWQKLGPWPNHPALEWVATLFLVLLADVAISSASYFLWERRFLMLKNRLEIIHSRPA